MVTVIVLVVCAFILVVAYNVFVKKPKPFGSQPSTASILYNAVTAKKEEPTKVQRSKYFPEDFYVGRTGTLDPSIKYLTPNTMFGFPTDVLMVNGLKYFNVDNNEMEEVAFRKTGDKEYILLVDPIEEQVFFLNRVTSVMLTDDNNGGLSEDSIVLNEDGNEYEYHDLTGLIQSTVRDENGSYLNNRLIRVYTRELTEDTDEYLVCIADGRDRLDYYVGFTIASSQIE